ncbi:MAG TPA: lysophospholipid acyltransferase family protein [Steroidobacteraceae bacterium]|nr:lysophospholipid acyltransferase family protein [Steroidobacteraceae bacterium]
MSASIGRTLQLAGDQARFWASLLLFALLGLLWSLVAIPAYLLMPRRLGTRIGRLGFNRLSGLYVSWLALVRAYRLDLREMEALGAGPAVILAPNHPSMIDAVLIMTCHPHIVCVMKAQLMNNVLLGSGARLARYISNHPPRRMVLDAVKELQRGESLLLFPEGTRTISAPVNSFTTSAGLIAKRARVPVQTLIVETDSPYLSKGWSPFHRPRLPITFRIRLGRRFEPPEDVRAFDAALEIYFRAQLTDSLQKQWLNELHPPRPG